MALPQPPTITHCYRHPDREAGRRCTRCGKPACSDCLVQATVGSHCLDCAKQSQPDVRTRVRIANAKQPTLVTSVIIAINIAVFVWVAAGDTSTIFAGFGGSEVSSREGELGLSRGVMVVTPDHDWYRLVTSGFLHFGIIHIAFNMYLLYLLGNLLEPVLGRVKFALLYFASLLGGSAGVLLLSHKLEFSISGGASGAVFGLMGAATIAMHRQGVNILQTGLGRLLVFNLVLTFLVPNISIGGHLGGLAAGTVCGAIMLSPKWKPVPDWLKYATPVVVMVVAVAISMWRVT
jgi:membrane associated rhomboid family serine protease